MVVSRIRQAPARYVAWLAVFGLLAAALLHFSVTLSTVLSSTLQHPFQDQFRLNMRYLTVPFPLSVFLLENGHRPVIPGVLRYLELAWLGGKTWLQASAAWAAMAVATVMLLWDVTRDFSRNAARAVANAATANETARGAPRLIAASGACLVFTLLWWNANARMYFHPYEAVHLFPILAATMVAIWCMHAAMKREAGYRAWCGALLACTFATFTFGPGITSFAALFALAVLTRQNVKVLALIALCGALVFASYLWLLPDSEGISRATRVFAPGKMLLYFLARMGSPISELTAGLLDLPARITLASLTGAGVLATAIAATFAEWKLHRRPSRLLMVAFGLFVVGASTNFLIVANRTDYFSQHPDQLLADRYLFWGCVAWLGTALLVLTRPAVAIGWRPWALGSATFAFSMAALVTSQGLSSWSAEVYRRVELGTSALVLGMSDPTYVRDIADLDLNATYRSAAMMRNYRVAGYESRIGEQIVMSARGDLPIVELSGTSAEGVVSGKLGAALASDLRTKTLWLVTATGHVVGRATMTRTCVLPHPRLYIGLVRRDCFEGYVVPDSLPSKWLVTFSGDSPVMLAELRTPAS